MRTPAATSNSSSALTAPRAVVVSHPCIVPINQSVYNVVADQGWSVELVVPNRWRHEYAAGDVAPQRLENLQAGFRRAPIALPGQPQRHFYKPGTTRAVLSAARPSVVFLEEESFSVPAFQWSMACWRRGIPFGVQADENLDRPLPLPARAFRSWTLRHAAFVAARSPRAQELVERWGARGRIEVIPHAVPLWTDLPSQQRAEAEFTIGFAGRFVEEKGLRDLVAAAHRLPGPARLLLAGNGPLRSELAGSSNGVAVEILNDITHEEMTRAYARMDVLVLPSHTTPTWAEQFGRVLVEALWCGVPVVGSDSGEIPWVIRTTGGGLVFPEGDVGALAERLAQLRAEPELRQRLARTGRTAVEELFGVEAVGRRLSSLMREVSGAPAPATGEVVIAQPMKR